METARDLLGKRQANMKRLEKEAPNLCHGFRNAPMLKGFWFIFI